MGHANGQLFVQMYTTVKLPGGSLARVEVFIKYLGQQFRTDRCIYTYNEQAIDSGHFILPAAQRKHFAWTNVKSSHNPSRHALL